MTCQHAADDPCMAAEQWVSKIEKIENETFLWLWTLWSQLFWSQIERKPISESGQHPNSNLPARSRWPMFDSRTLDVGNWKRNISLVINLVKLIVLRPDGTKTHFRSWTASKQWPANTQQMVFVWQQNCGCRKFKRHFLLGYKLCD